MERRVIEELIDAHSHLQNDSKLIRQTPRTFKTCLCTSTINEWEKTLNLTLNTPGAYLPCFGIHPWYAQEVDISDPEWIKRIETLVEICPHSLIGEIGVDKLYKAHGVSYFKTGQQQKVFDIQVQLALRLQRPVNIHCVQAHGWLFDYFRALGKQRAKQPIPNILLHSWSGSADMVAGLTRLPHIGSKFYFSFSSAINLSSGSKKLEGSIMFVPKDRLLIESDLPCVSSQSKVMLRILRHIGNVRQWSQEETIKITKENSLRFFGLTDKGEEKLSVVDKVEDLSSEVDKVEDLSLEVDKVEDKLLEVEKVESERLVVDKVEDKLLEVDKIESEPLVGDKVEDKSSVDKYEAPFVVYFIEDE